jgi:hypothetical protein
MAEEKAPQTYEDYGYDNKMMKSDQKGATSFSADSAMNFAGLSPAVLSGGDITGDLYLSSGRIIIRDDTGGEAIVINNQGININSGMITIDRFGIIMNDGSNDRVLIGYQKDGF